MRLFEKHLSKDKKHIIYKFLGIKLKFKNNIIRHTNTINLTNAFDTTKYIYKKIDIIVPIFNGYEYIKDLLGQIKNNTDLDYELYVIDDNSSDKNVFPLLQKFEQKFDGKLHLIKNESNLGFLKTVNKGLSLTQNDVCILNTDIKLPKNWATRLMYYIFKYDDVASVTPFSNSATFFSFPQMWIDNNLNIDYKIIDKKFSKISPDSIPLLEFPTGVGFCMGMSKKALNKIGFFDEIFEKGYGEENDWCMRALRGGFKNVLCPNLFVFHKHGGSFEPEEKKLLCKNHLRIINSRYPEYSKLILDSSKNETYLLLRKLLNDLCYKNHFKTLLQNIFSIKNIDKHKIITILGIKIKFKSQKLFEKMQNETKFNLLSNRLTQCEQQITQCEQQITQCEQQITRCEQQITQLENLSEYYLSNLKNDVLKKHDKVIYTCITGGYDNLIQHTFINNNYDYICFTDNKNLLSQNRIGVWKIKPLLFDKLDNTKNARWHKINYFKSVSDYTESIWVDANVNIKTSYLFDIIKTNKSMILIPIHYKNDCIFQECDYVLECKREIENNVQIVRDFLRSQNMPEHYGLNETNVIYRNHSCQTLSNIMQDWFECVEKYSKRDQLSCSYAMWKNNIKIEDISIPNARIDTENFSIIDHKNNYME